MSAPRASLFSITPRSCPECQPIGQALPRDVIFRQQVSRWGPTDHFTRCPVPNVSHSDKLKQNLQTLTRP